MYWHLNLVDFYFVLIRWTLIICISIWPCMFSFDLDKNTALINSNLDIPVALPAVLQFGTYQPESCAEKTVSFNKGL